MPICKVSNPEVLDSYHAFLEDLAVKYTHCNSFFDEHNILQGLGVMMVMIPSMRQVRRNRGMAKKVFDNLKLVEDFLDILPPSQIICAIGQQECQRTELNRLIDDCIKLDEPEVEVTTFMTEIEAEIEGFIHEQDQLLHAIRQHLIAMKFFLDIDTNMNSVGSNTLYSGHLFLRFERVSKFEMACRCYMFSDIDTSSGFCGAYLEALVQADNSHSAAPDELNLDGDLRQFFHSGQELQCLLAIQGNADVRNRIYETFMHLCSVMVDKYSFLNPQRIFHFITLFISSSWSHYDHNQFNTIVAQLQGFSNLIGAMDIPNTTNLYFVNLSLGILIDDMSCMQRSLQYFQESAIDDYLIHLKSHAKNFYTYAKRCDQSHEYTEIRCYNVRKFLPGDLDEESYPHWEEKFASLESFEKFKETLKGEKCTICMENFTEDSVVSIFDKCPHVYCIDCAMKWLNTKNEFIVERTRCPACLCEVNSYIRSSSYLEVEDMIRRWRCA